MYFNTTDGLLGSGLPATNGCEELACKTGDLGVAVLFGARSGCEM